jgi:hypothetical protein
MSHYDAFNGDADGLCALHQLRLARPREAQLVTGCKRDIALLGRIPGGAGDSVTALDISLDVNREALLGLLERGVEIEYFDHHHAGDIPVHSRLTAHIDTDATVCTSIIVDRVLGGTHRPWAIVAAYGDNLPASAERLAATLGLDEHARAQLRELGENLNYNAYGDEETDLMIRPAELYRLLSRHRDPFSFIAGEPAAHELGRGRLRDLAMARQLAPEVTVNCGSIYVLPDTPWSRRVRGVFVNELATSRPHLAHAAASPDGAGGYTVSVRAPRDLPHGADELCRLFPTGNGRRTAAGITHLEAAALPDFVQAFERMLARGS